VATLSSIAFRKSRPTWMAGYIHEHRSFPKVVDQIVEQTSRFTFRVVSTVTYENRTHSEFPVPDFAYSGLGAGLTVRPLIMCFIRVESKQLIPSIRARLPKLEIGLLLDMCAFQRPRLNGFRYRITVIKVRLTLVKKIVERARTRLTFRTASRRRHKTARSSYECASSV